MSLQSIILRRFVAMSLTICLLLMDTALYASGLPTQEGLHEGYQEYLRNSDLGVVDEIFQGKSEKLIIYIQDAHDSLEAQANIAKLIDHAVNYYDLKTVFEEGFEGKVPTDVYFDHIQDIDIKDKVSYFLLDRLRIGGAEYAHINRTLDYDLVGADSLSLYTANIESYRKTIKMKERTDRDIDHLYHKMQRLANRYFPRELKEWMKLKKRLDERELNLLDYLMRMKSLQHSHDDQEYPNIKIILGEEIAQKVNRQALLESIDSKELFIEIQKLENSVAEHYLENARDRKVFDYYRNLVLIKKLSDLELTHAEYETTLQNLKSLKTQGIAEFAATYEKKSVVASTLWESNLQNAIEFYELAKERDRELDVQLQGFLKDKEQKTSILVFGGFHKQGITKWLKDRDIAYIVVSPRITGLSQRHQEYYKLMMSGPSGKYELSPNLTSGTRQASIFAEARQGVISHNQLMAGIQAVANAFQSTGKRWTQAYIEKVYQKAISSNSSSESRKLTKDAGNDGYSTLVLTQSEKAELRKEIEKFLNSKEHKKYFYQNSDELLEAFINPNRLSIPLRPKTDALSPPEKIAVTHEYSKYQNKMLNTINARIPTVIGKLFTAKLLKGKREPGVRDFVLQLHDKGIVNSEVDKRSPLLEQGFHVVSVKDYSSGRGFDEGAMVFQVVLKKGNEKFGVFIKGFGVGPKGRAMGQKLEPKAELFEEYWYKALSLVGRNSTQASYYSISDPIDTLPEVAEGFTILEEIPAMDTNKLFVIEDGDFSLKSEYEPYINQLIREFGAGAAQGDFLRRGDRPIVQNGYPMYPANYMISLEALKAGKPALYNIDAGWLLNKDNDVSINDMRNNGNVEMSILLAEKGRDSIDEAQYQIFREAYLKEWNHWLSKKVEIEKLTISYFGEDSISHQVFQEILKDDPEKLLVAYRNALLEYKDKSEKGSESRALKKKRMTVSGASGDLGAALTRYLDAKEQNLKPIIRDEEGRQRYLARSGRELENTADFTVASLDNVDQMQNTLEKVMFFIIWPHKWGLVRSEINLRTISL